MTKAAPVRGLICAALAALTALVLATTAEAATFTVNTTNDTSDSGGCTSVSTCSLRDAVAAANAAPGSTITVPAGDYVLNTQATPLGDLVISHSVTINGAGARTTTVDANKKTRAFTINSGTATVRIAGLTIKNGNAAGSSVQQGDGGAIFTEGILDLIDDTVSDNVASFSGGGIATPDVVGPIIFAPRSSVHPPSSGSPPPSATVTLTGTTISGNQVTGGAGTGLGGGLSVIGSLEATNSTIARNSVTDPGADQGGGIATGPPLDGAGNPVTTDHVTLLNDTISGNTVTATPGPPPSSAPTDDGGGLSGVSVDLTGGSPDQATLDAENTIISGNKVDGVTSDCGLETTSLTDHNLSSDASCGFTDGGSKQNADPKLGPLQNNGGGSDTEAIGPGSPALDAGDNSGCPSADQRGVSRPQNGICDIGAYEFVPLADLAVTKTTSKHKHHVGGTATYHITVTNHGPQGATGVRLTDSVPDGETVKSLEPSQGSCSNGRPVTCSVGAIAAGGSATVKVVAKLTSAGKQKDTATVSGDQTDPDHGNDSASAAVHVRASAPHIKLIDVGCTSGVLEVKVKIGSGSPLQSVRVYLNGKQVVDTTDKTFSFKIDRSQLNNKPGRLTIKATNQAGETSKHATVIPCQVSSTTGQNNITNIHTASELRHHFPG